MSIVQPLSSSRRQLWRFFALYCLLMADLLLAHALPSGNHLVIYLPPPPAGWQQISDLEDSIFDVPKFGFSSAGRTYMPDGLIR